MSDGLERELVAMAIELCNVKDIEAHEVNVDLPVIGPESALDLDSLDALEVVIAVQKNYNVRIGGEETSREILQSFTVLAKYIRSNRPEAG